MTDTAQELVPDSRNPKTLAVMETLKSFASLSSLLRTLGAGILVASVSMFLFNGWSSSDDVGRYFMLLAQTLVLTATGMLIGSWVKESKGARLFLSLSLVAGVANFAVLGGLVYSQVQWDGALAYYPQFAHWHAGSFASALTAAAVGWAALVPVSAVGFLALARRSARRLAPLFMLSGAAFLVPVRGTAYVAVIVGVLTVVLLVQVVRAKRSDKTLATPEGRFARLVLFSMPAVIVGRGLYLYGADAVMLTVVSSLVFLVLRQLSRDPKLGERGQVILNRLSVIPAASTALGIAGVLMHNHLLAEAMWIPVCVTAGAGLLLEISVRSPSGGAGYRRLAGAVVTLGMLANLWLHPGVDTALVSTVIGLVVTVIGYSDKQRLVFASGLVTFLTGVVYQCYTAFEAFNLGSWTALALVGILAIVSGSVLERHGALFKARLSNWRRSFREWQN